MENLYILALKINKKKPPEKLTIQFNTIIPEILKRMGIDVHHCIISKYIDTELGNDGFARCRITIRVN